MQDTSWEKHLRIGEVLEEVSSGNFRLVFIRLTEEQQEGEPMKYLYRALWFARQSNELMMSFNLEKSVAQTCCLGAFVREEHLNFGLDDPDMSFEEFKAKAIELMGDVLKDGPGDRADSVEGSGKRKSFVRYVLSNNGCIGGLVMAVIIVVIIAVALVASHMRKAALEAAFKPFKGHLQEYLNITGLEEDSFPAGGPYLKGKIITINTGSKDFDPFFLELPEDLQAKSPDEVGTIAWLKWDNEGIGEYSDGKTAYVQTCEVTLIDREKALCIAKMFFRGADPPSEIGEYESTYGPRPKDEIIQFLSGLRRR